MVRVISLSDAAYDALDQLKQGRDSFSAVVLRLAEQERIRRLKALAGSWKMSEAEYKEFMAGVYERRRVSKPRNVHL